MTDENRETNSVLSELTDELRVQAWLANKELSKPSLGREDAHEEASALARMRDEIRVQMHLGKLDANDEFEKMEGRWRHLMQNDIQPAANAVANELEAAAHDVLREIRDTYHRVLGR